jgi:hypothetical protein
MALTIACRASERVIRARRTESGYVSRVRWTVLLLAALATGGGSGCSRQQPPPRPVVGDWESVIGQAALQLSLREDGTGAAHVWSTTHPDERIRMEITSWSIDPDRSAISIQVINPDTSEPREMGGAYEWLGERLIVDHVSEEGVVQTRTYTKLAAEKGGGKGG